MKRIPNNGPNAIASIELKLIVENPGSGLRTYPLPKLLTTMIFWLRHESILLMYLIFDPGDVKKFTFARFWPPQNSLP